MEELRNSRRLALLKYTAAQNESELNEAIEEIQKLNQLIEESEVENV